jgi:hypothetical protein
MTTHQKIVVYTAISRGYDRLPELHPLWEPEADFVAFLEEPLEDAGWTVRPLYRRFHDPCRNAKVHKVLPHVYFPQAEYSLWIDGSVAITSPLPLQRWIEKYLSRHDLAVFKHRFRNCLYDEAVECLRWNLDSGSVINRQMQKYYREGYPLANGLAECTVLFRRHTEKVRRFNEVWHQEIKRHSRRDQLSFNYAAEKTGLTYSHLPGGISQNPHFQWLPHLGRRYRPKADAFTRAVFSQPNVRIK